MTIAPINAANTHPLILARLAMPITHHVVTRFADGTERIFGERSIGAAENYATGERRKIGRDLISRGDDLGHKAGDIVRVVAVDVVAL